MLITENLKKRFCKDLNLPIKIFIEPYFTERLNLYDNYLNCKQKYEDFCKLLENYQNEEEYFAEYNEFKEKIIQYISNKDAYIRFNTEDFNKFKPESNFSKNNIYKETFVNKYFLSFDLKSGNFTALRHYSEDIFDGKTTYEDFVSDFTANKHLIESKYIRQVIFGTLNPKRQVRYEEFLMNEVLKVLLNFFSKDSVVYLSTDEVIFQIDDIELFKDKIPLLEKTVNDFYNKKITLKMEFFKLSYLSEFDIYLKNISYSYTKTDGSSEHEHFVIKNATSLTLPFALRHLYSLDDSEFDNYFIYEGRLAKFIS